MTINPISKDTTDIKPIKESEINEPPLLTLKEVQIYLDIMMEDRPITQTKLRASLRKREIKILKRPGTRLIRNEMIYRKELLNPDKRKSW